VQPTLNKTVLGRQLGLRTAVLVCSCLRNLLDIEVYSTGSGDNLHRAAKASVERELQCHMQQSERL
jgi:hypothetical protein